MTLMCWQGALGEYSGCLGSRQLRGIHRMSQKTLCYGATSDAKLLSCPLTGALRASPVGSVACLAPAHPSAINWSPPCRSHLLHLDTGVVDSYFSKLLSLVIWQLQQDEMEAMQEVEDRTNEFNKLASFSNSFECWTFKTQICIFVGKVGTEALKSVKETSSSTPLFTTGLRAASSVMRYPGACVSLNCLHT